MPTMLREPIDRSSKLGRKPAAEVRFATAECGFGRLLVAATARGICAVSFGNTDAELAAFLAAEFPAAQRCRDDAGLNDWLQELLRHLAGEQMDLNLPLDVRGTAFQWEVWEELRRIPYGETRSYRAVAEALGKPRAVRAVARACAANPASIAIPCHRVIGTSGQLTGYRWGVDRKRKLLEWEQHNR